jgi:hypothetical protein
MNVTLAKAGYKLKEKINEKVVFEQGSLPLKLGETAFVRVSFTINTQGGCEIIQMNYSDETIKDMLVNKLEEIKIDELHHSEEIYNYNFSFIKH